MDIIITQAPVDKSHAADTSGATFSSAPATGEMEGTE